MLVSKSLNGQTLKVLELDLKRKYAVPVHDSTCHYEKRLVYYFYTLIL